MANPPRAPTANAVSSSSSPLSLLWAISISISILILVLPTALAQDVSLLPSSASDSFPACALDCALLQQAQDSCVPPAAPQSDSSTYVTCFCQSNLITSLHNSPDGVCDDSCNNPSDLNLLQTWFNNYCSSGGSVQTSTSSTTTGTSPNTASATTDGATVAPVSKTPAHQSWWDGHYQWVIMLIVLAIGFTVLGVGGTYLKRRHDAKNPGLYHGADSGSRSNSRIFSIPRAQTTSPPPDGLGSNPFLAPNPHDAIPAEVTVPKDVVPRTRTPARLQRHREPEPGDLEISEVGR